MHRFTPSTLAHLLLLAVVALWGITFTLVKDALQDASPLLFNLFRMALAAVALFLINRRHLRQLSRPTIVAGAVVGFFLATGYQLQTLGLAHTTPTKSAFITGLVVVFVPLLTIIPSVRPASTPAPGLSVIFGALLAFTGLVLLTTPVGTNPTEILRSMGTGDILTLFCAIAFAGHLLALAHTSLRIPIPQLATLQIAFATLTMAITLPFGGKLYLTLTPRLVVALAITSLLATAAAFTIQSWAQQHLPPTHTALLLTLEPVFAWLTSFLFFGERLGPRSLIGALFILGAILLIELLPSRSPLPDHPL
ncbi:DMT family transporter [Edaphobacter albus]|uniref:DMT family transporter n=1 Tax=Edaphobacter sp. 4G125 TaxID=2763071 RepID=UPI0016481673|nr:DMT family transporter [Edaphobacter sp. 4G125]QNI35285.1 DMT family transporter [Edaphobacter sp. 4G125]